jgi:drug/metabolite transporter (DMT)-like permease
MRRFAGTSTSRVSLLLVALAAAMFGTEGLLRRPLLDNMSVASIVLAEHLLLCAFAIPVLIAHRRTLAQLSLRSWLILFIIGAGASGGAALLFTQALNHGNPTTASLLQNAQPLIVVLLALMLLKERLPTTYWPCLVASIVGVYLLSFATFGPVSGLALGELHATAYAIGAAALWASGTVLARLVLREISYVTLTAARIAFALPLIATVAVYDGSIQESVSGIGAAPLQLIGAALIPGLLGILLFYRGLSGTKASYAVLAEFTYPAAAIIGNWMILGTTIAPLQALGCLILLTAIFVLVRRSAPADPAPTHETTLLPSTN